MSYEKELEVAEEIAKQAGRFLLNNVSNCIVESANNHDIKLDLDKKSENMIISRLTEAFNYPVLAEESGASELIGHNQLHWIVDPIDGTLNYFQGIPFACVSVALWKGRQPLVGVVYDFNQDEVVSGLVGVGAYLNNVKLEVPKKVKKNQAILATGFPSYLQHDSDTLLEVIRDIKEYKKIRLFGSAALSLAYVALGRVHAYHENAIALWDVAAGIAILESLGLKVEIEMLDDTLAKVHVEQLCL